MSNSVEGVTTNERTLAGCFASKWMAHDAALFAGFVPMNAVDANAGVKCVDFDERACGFATNVNACLGNPIGFPSN